jgi:hypothetical protein
MTTTAPTHPTIHPSRALRRLLTINGAANAAGGALLLPLARTLQAPTGLSTGLLAGIGVFYLVYGAAMWLAATRPRPRAAVIVAVIALNPLWALACLLLLTTGPTMLGAVLLATEAAVVTGFAALQFAAR